MPTQGFFRLKNGAACAFIALALFFVPLSFTATKAERRSPQVSALQKRLKGHMSNREKFSLRNQADDPQGAAPNAVTANEDIAGSYQGATFGNAANCTDPLDNGGYFADLNVRVNTPTVDNQGIRRLTGTITVGYFAADDQDLILDFTAVLSAPGDNRTLSNGTLAIRSPSNLTGGGTISSGSWQRAANGNPDHLVMQYSGSGSAFGSNCSIGGTLSVFRVGTNPSTTFSPGVVTRAVSDTQVIAAQQNGQFTITPRSGIAGEHYNGFVSDQSINLTDYDVSVEVKQTATGGAQTVFGLGVDTDNFYRFVKVDGNSHPNLIGLDDNGTDAPADTTSYLVFEVKVNGMLSSFNIPYDATQHRFWRFRHDPVPNTINFETSADRVAWSLQKSVVLQKSVSALTAELSAGTSTAVTNPGPAQFGTFHLGDIYEVLADYDGDLRNDISIFRPSGGVWYILKSTTGNSPGQFQSIGWGASGDIPVPGDYDGDGRVDLAIFRPSTGLWFILKSSTGYDPAQNIARGWGAPGDKPIPADFDGDGRTDIAIFRPSTGVWFILKSSTNYDTTQYLGVGWGSNGDVPIPRDFDGDGKADIALFRPSNGAWYLLFSSTGYSPSQYQSYGWGLSTDLPVPRDYDGDGKTDIAIYRPSTGVWFILKSSAGYSSAQFQGVGWGSSTDLPVPGDYDGDGRTDIAIFRPSTGVWYVLKSSTGYNPSQFLGVGWGSSSDLPISIGVIR